MKFYEVGGCIRDEILGIPTKDIDFAVEVESFELMRDSLKEDGFEIFVETPEFLTIRAKVPKGHPLEQRTKVADFVMCRKDSPGSDGRRPDYVEPGTIYDDLARRDFTINAIARDVDTGELLDPHGGVNDLTRHSKGPIIQFVGDPESRIKEDGLRVLRGYRFAVTKKGLIGHSTFDWFDSELAAEMLHKVSVERIREELEKMFAFDSLKSLRFISTMRSNMQDAIFRDGLRLSATLKGVNGK